MADVNANIGVHIDTSAALAELKALQRQLANFHSSVAKNSAAAAQAQKGLQTNLLNAINATGKFNAQMGLVRSSTESFTHALETNKLSMREYFRYAGGSTRTFGKLFKQEFNTIGKVAEERVKKMQTQYIKMGRDASGAIRSMSITPRTLDMNDYATKTALAAQKQALLNQLLKQGSTNLLNFGKNTQWAGRQLMVGFTIPLAYFGTAAAKTFMDLEKQAIRFKRVYGDMFTTSDETNKALADVQQLAESFTKYGVAVAETMEMAANAAAMGKTGADLTAQVAEATRLAVLGGVEQAQALETTISVTNAFGIAAEDLAKKVNFLNAVENQTVVSIEDLTIAIPKAGPVVKQLGGDVEDLAFFLTAMKEGGINASEGANALKSGLASLINPTKKASDMLAGFGINIKGIVESNQGNIRNTVIGFAQALDTLDPLNRARAIEQLFGKFQFSRLSTLFQNVTKDGTQAARVLELAGASVEELAILSERELGVLEDAIGTDFKESIEKLKLAIAPIGKEFLKAITPVAKAIGSFLEKFNNLGDGTKKFIVVATTLVGVIGPVLLMTFGLLANGVANIIKLFITMRSGFLRAGTNTNLLAQQTSYLNTEQLEAATVAASLNQAHTRLTQSFSAETTAVRLLRQAYIDATIAAANFARTNPGMMMPGGKFTPKKFARGVTEVPGTGNKDTVPSMLTPGEAVIPAPVAQDPRFRPIIDAMVNGTLQGFGTGSTGVFPVNVPSDFNPEGKIFNARQANSAKNIQNFLTSLKKNSDGTYSYLDPKGKYSKSNIPVSKIANVLNERSSAGSFNLSQIQEKLGIGSTGFKASTKKSGVTSRPQSIADAMNKLPNKGIPGLDLEVEAIKKRFAQSGLTISDRKQARLFQVDASHIRPEIGADGRKIWKISNIAPDTGYVNNFISNSLKGKLGKALDKMSKQELKLLGIDKNAFRSMYAGGDPSKGSHPVTAKQAETLQAIARYATQPGVIKKLGLTKNALYQAHALDAGLGTRLKTGFYKGGIKSLKNIMVAMAPGEGLVDNKGRASQVTIGTGKPKTKDTMQIGGGKQDTRLLPASKVMKVIPRPGFKGSGSFAYGAIGGLDNPSVATPGSGFRSGAIAPNMRVADTQLQQLIAALNNNTTAVSKGAAATTTMAGTTALTAKEAKREQRAQRAASVGRVAGPVAGIAGIGAMAGFMTGNNSMGMAMMGISALATIAPMLTNPISILVAAMVGLVAGFKLIDKKHKEMAKKQSEYIDSISGTTTKMKKVGEVTGKVGASELMARRRQDSLPDKFSQQYNRAGQQFGTNFMSSDIGKEISKGFAESLLKDRSIATKQFALQLSSYVSDGVIDGVQAGDIARQIAVDFNDMSLYPSIVGQLTSIIGPDGTNILNDPIKVRMLIIEEQTGLSNIQAEGIVAGDKGLIGKEETGKAREAAAAASAASYSQSFELAKAQVDATNLQYQKDLEILKNKQKITTIEKEREKIQTNINSLIEKNKKDNLDLSTEMSKILKDQQAAYEKTSRSQQGLLPGQINFVRNAFLEASKQQVVTKFAGTQQEGAAKALLENTKNLKSTDLEVKINAIAASGTNPTLLASLINMFKNDEEQLNKQIDLAVSTKGIDTTVSLLGNLGMIEDADTKKQLFIDIINITDNQQFEDIQSVLTKISEMAGKDFNVNAYLKTNGLEKLINLTNQLNKLDKVISPINKVTQIENIGLTIEEITGITSNWEYFMSLPDTVRKTAIQTYVVALDMVTEEQIQAEIAKRVAAAGAVAGTVANYLNSPQGKATIANELAMQATRPQYSPSQQGPNKPPPADDDFDDSGTRDTTLDDLLKKLKLTRDASVNAEGGIEELKRVFKNAKGDVTKFTGVIEQLNKQGADEGFIDFVSGLDNATQGTYLNVNKLKKGVVELTARGKEAMALYQEVELGAFRVSADSEIKNLEAQANGFERLTAAGVGVADSLELIANAEMMRSLAQAKTPQELDKLIAKFNKLKETQQKVLEDTDPEKAFDIQMNKAMKYYDFLEKEAKAAAQPEIDRVNALIDANEKLIDTKQRSIEMDYDRPIEKLNQDLAIINKAADGINKKYDEQEKALEKISNLNQEIAEQEKGRLTLADALTSGDISAAARAAQEMRATAAANAIQRSSSALQIARESEVSALTAGGLTRAQIEEKIYSLEQQRLPIIAQITALQDKNYNYSKNELEPLTEALNARIKNIDTARTAWENQQLAIQAAAFEADKTNAKFKIGEGIVAAIKKLWDDIKDKNITLSVNTVNTPLVTSTNTSGISTTGRGGGVFRSGAIAQMYGGKVLPMAMGGMVPKYMVAGGGIGSDTVPAMLTPGEFVMNKRATDQFGPMLSMLNESKYPSMIGSSYADKGAGSGSITSVSDNSSNVYNYSVGITVPQSNANPNDIARAVIGQIKYIDNQRIRGQR